MLRAIKILIAGALCAAGLAAQVTPVGPKLSGADQGGILYASNFGQWQVPAGNLGQYSWNNGSYCQPTVGSVYPGITINGFATGTPVEIVDMDTPSHDEIVTPMAYYLAPNLSSCSISITPLYGHNHFHFVSATAGLQEALNWAGATSYTVILTPDWTLLGGTTGMITAAQGNANVTILDQRNAAAVVYTWNGSAYIATGGGGGCPLTGCTYTGPLSFSGSGTASTTLANLGGAGTGACPVGQYEIDDATGGPSCAQVAASQISGISAYALLTGATFTGQVVVTSPIQVNPIGTATSVSGNYSSYNFQALGSYWNGTVATGDTWTMNDVLGTGTTPTSTLTIQHTGSSGVATVSVPSLTAGAGFAVAASGATSVTSSGVTVVPLTLYGHNVSQSSDLLDVYNYSGGSIVAAISPTGGLAGSSLIITGCGAGYYAKADGAGCGIPAGTYSLPTATSSTLGGVKPDGSTITNTSGAISVTYGTTSGTAAQGNDSRIVGAAQCTAGTTGSDCLQLSGGLVPVGNLPAATPTAAGAVVKVANTTFTTSTSSVAANTCNSVVQVAMTGVTTSMTFGITPSADTSAAAGWGSTGGLVLDTWPTAGYLNYKICNQTTAAISTPGAVTFNVSAQ